MRRMVFAYVVLGVLVLLAWFVWPTPWETFRGESGPPIQVRRWDGQVRRVTAPPKKEEAAGGRPAALGVEGR